MSVFKNANGVWGFKVRLNGKQYKKESKEWTRKVALEQERLFMNEYAPTAETITLKQLYGMMIKELSHSLKQSSLDAYDKYFKKIEPIANVPVSELDSKTLKEWQMNIVNDVKGESVKKVQNLLKRVLRYGYDNDYLPSNKLANFKNITVQNNGKLKQCDFYTKEQYEKLISVVKREDDLMMYRLLFYTGCRIGELRALQKKHVNGNKITIEQSVTPNGKTVQSPKTMNSYRVVVIDNNTMNMLQSYCVKLNDEDYISSRTNVIYYYDTFRRRHVKYCELANVPYLKIHGFRHSHVSLLINKGFSAHDIADRIGDTVTMVNEIYGHLYEDAQERIAKALD